MARSLRRASRLPNFSRPASSAPLLLLPPPAPPLPPLLPPRHSSPRLVGRLRAGVASDPCKAAGIVRSLCSSALPFGAVAGSVLRAGLRGQLALFSVGGRGCGPSRPGRRRPTGGRPGGPLGCARRRSGGVGRRGEASGGVGRRGEAWGGVGRRRGGLALSYGVHWVRSGGALGRRCGRRRGTRARGTGVCAWLDVWARCGRGVGGACASPRGLRGGRVGGGRSGGWRGVNVRGVRPVPADGARRVRRRVRAGTGVGACARRPQGVYPSRSECASRPLTGGRRREHSFVSVR